MDSKSSSLVGGKTIWTFAIVVTGCLMVVCGGLLYASRGFKSVSTEGSGESEAGFGQMIGGTDNTPSESSMAVMDTNNAGKGSVVMVGSDDWKTHVIIVLVLATLGPLAWAFMTLSDYNRLNKQLEDINEERRDEAGNIEILSHKDQVVIDLSQKNTEVERLRNRLKNTNINLQETNRVLESLNRGDSQRLSERLKVTVNEHECLVNAKSTLDQSMLVATVELSNLVEEEKGLIANVNILDNGINVLESEKINILTQRLNRHDKITYTQVELHDILVELGRQYEILNAELRRRVYAFKVSHRNMLRIHSLNGLEDDSLKVIRLSRNVLRDHIRMSIYPGGDERENIYRNGKGRVESFIIQRQNLMRAYSELVKKTWIVDAGEEKYMKEFKDVCKCIWKLIVNRDDFDDIGRMLCSMYPQDVDCSRLSQHLELMRVQKTHLCELLDDKDI